MKNLLNQPKKVIIPIPQEGFDPTEVAIPWKMISSAGHQVFFASPEGRPANADSKMITGDGLGVFKPFLIANKNGRQAYEMLQENDNFKNPLPYGDLTPKDFDALVLPGGHAPGMKQYLESPVLQEFTADFFDQHKVVGAICHGVVLAARSRSRITGKSVLWGKKTTALPQFMEMTAWNLTRYVAGDYYRTYPKTVQQEVTEALEKPADFIRGPKPVSLRSVIRDSAATAKIGFAVIDDNYISARWPGDAHRFSEEIIKKFIN